MAKTNRPKPNANRQKAKGEPWSSEQDTVERVSPVGDSDNAGGITNRPLDEEVGNQDALPPRGTRRDEDDPEE